jgi:hypothetical protein
VTVTLRGALGGPAGIPLTRGLLAAEEPATLVATALTQYRVLVVSPVMRQVFGVTDVVARTLQPEPNGVPPVAAV